MTKPILTIALCGLLAATGINLRAADAPAVKLVTVDVIRVLDGYWKTKQSLNELETTRGLVQEQIETQRKDYEEVGKTFEDAREQAQSAALTQEARDRAEGDARKLFSQLREKEQQIQQFIENAEQKIQLQMSNHRKMAYADIKAAVNQLAKAQGATLVVDTSGPTNLGISSVIYADPAYDITDAVIAEINKSMPVDFKME